MKYLRFSVCILILLALAGQVMAATALTDIQNKINKASKLWGADQNKAQSMLKEAFADAIHWTKEEFIDSVRQKGFYLAVCCYSPDLVTETMLAADTYLKLFPKGRYAAKMYIFKAMSLFAADEDNAAVEALEQAISLKKNGLSYKDQTTFFSGYINAGYHRSAEKFIEGEKLVRPSFRLTKDLRRFHRGNDKIEVLVKKVKAGEISGIAAANRLDAAIEQAYFAKKAPEAALLSLGIKDSQKEAYNPVVLEWCGLTRSVKHSTSPQLREKKCLEFLDTFKQANPEETYKALQELRNVYLYEIRDKIAARRALEAMKKVPGYGKKAEIEETICDFTPSDLITEKGNLFLNNLLKSRLLPYDNGALPVITEDHVKNMLIISDIALGKNSEVKVGEEVCWGNIPVAVLYHAAIDEKDKAWEKFSKIKPALSPQVEKMVEDCILPLYLDVPRGERTFMAGLVAVEKFPSLGTDLIISSISDDPRMFKSEHGLAVLADVYNKHMAFKEAQKVWNILSRLHPDSIWLR